MTLKDSSSLNPNRCHHPLITQLNGYYNVSYCLVFQVLELKMVVANVKALDFTFCPLLDTVIVHGEFSAKELHCNKLPDFMSVKKFRLDTKQVHSKNILQLENILHVEIMLDAKFEEDFIAKVIY